MYGVHFLISGGKDAFYSAKATEPREPSKNTHQQVHVQFRSSEAQNLSASNLKEKHVRLFLITFCT